METGEHSMAKKSKAVNENGIYPSWPAIPCRSRLGRGTTDEWETWHRLFDGLREFQHGNDFRYPDLPFWATLPDYKGPGAKPFDWETWLQQIKPWLENLFTKWPERFKGEDVVTAIETCDWLLTQQREQALASAEMFGRAVFLGMTVERIYAMQFDELVKSAKRSKPGRAKGGAATRILTQEQEKLALRIIAEKGRGLGPRWKSAACTRAATELKSSHNIDVSKDTLLRLLRREEGMNQR